MLALNRARRAGRQDIASRACRSYPRLLDFYDPTVMQWHDLRRFHAEFSALTRAELQRQQS
eukprot:6975822-Pyramimonas_sp.AAC.1